MVVWSASHSAHKHPSPIPPLSVVYATNLSVFMAQPVLLDLFPVHPGMGGDDGHWITKLLSLSDVNTSARLSLSKRDVKESVLPLMDEERRAACESREGLRVKVWDLDTHSEHELSLKQWKPAGSFLLANNWPMDFVRRRNLQKDDHIWLRWDNENQRFLFQS